MPAPALAVHCGESHWHASKETGDDGGQHTYKYTSNVYSTYTLPREGDVSRLATYRAGGLATKPLLQLPNNVAMPDPRKFTLSATLDF